MFYYFNSFVWGNYWHGKTNAIYKFCDHEFVYTLLRECIGQQIQTGKCLSILGVTELCNCYKTFLIRKTKVNCDVPIILIFYTSFIDNFLISEYLMLFECIPLWCLVKSDAIKLILLTDWFLKNILRWYVIWITYLMGLH